MNLDIDRRLDALSEFAGKASDVDSFVGQVLHVVLDLTQASGGAIWTHDGSTFRLRRNAGLMQLGVASNAELQKLHEDSLDRVLQTQQFLHVENPAQGSTAFYFHKSPLESAEFFILELFTHGESLNNDFLEKLLDAIDEISLDFYRLHQESKTKRLDMDWSNVEAENLVRLHRYNDFQEVSFDVVNELVSAFDVDRAIILEASDRSCEVVAVSGVMKFDQRSAELLRLTRLVREVIRSDSALEFPSSFQLPPQIESVLQDYVEHARCEWMRILLLEDELRTSRSEAPSKRLCRGAIVLERMTPREHQALGAPAEHYLKHACSALVRCAEQDSIPLRRLGLSLGKIQRSWKSKLSRFLVKGMVVAIVVGCVGMIPVPFRIDVDGNYQPEDFHNIYVPFPGEVTEVFVKHLDQVEAQQPLLKIRSAELDLKLEELRTQRSVTMEKLRSIEATRLGERRSAEASPTSALELSASERELQLLLESQNEQIDIVRRLVEQLVLRSPGRGQVLSWNPFEPLQNRPVQQGQKLITIASPGDRGKLMLWVREEDVRHVTRHQQKSPPAQITFKSASNPEWLGKAELTEIGTIAEAMPGSSPRLRLLATVVSPSMENLRPGGEVQARIHCGTTALGYYWLRRTWDWILYHW